MKRKTAPRAPRPGAVPALAILLAILVVLGAAGCSGPRGGAAEKGPGGAAPPTVLLVTIDTLRADRVGCYGRADAGTPRLDALAAAGARFTAAQTTAPITTPAHASILTGRTLPGHGVVENGTFALPEEVPTLPEAFKSRGFATGAFVSSQVLARAHGLARGFDVYDDRMPPSDARQGPILRFAQRRGVDTVDSALTWLIALGPKPAFLWVHLFEPHAPYDPPPDLAARYKGNLYQGEVAEADRALGRLLDGLAAEGRDRDLLVVVAADHGEGLGEHDEATHGIFLYQGVMHVPLVVAGASRGIRPAVIDGTVSLADLAPTLAELVELPPLAGADGLSLAAALTGKGPLPARPGVFAESHTPRIQYGWSGLRAFVNGPAKLIEAPRAELFDLAEDPKELRDLAAARPAEVDAARRSLALLVQRARDAAPEASGERAVSEEEMAQLRALGYAASARRADAGELVEREAVDPKDRGAFLKQYDAALVASQSSRPETALPLFEALRAVEPDNPAFLESYGRALILTGRTDEAIGVFRHAVQVDPGFALGWHRLGQLLDSKRDRTGAEAAYRRAIATDPLAIVSYKALASLLVEAGRDADALKVLTEAQALDPGDKAIANLLAQVRVRTAK
ncbi:MAG: sulfatase-like hydrolase/transferase [Acidobacteria bacterium]|jgi:arylsulfatase A-like enzyme|nr:sulfatase-like hydrolase/transferase [Acidobacteriota bacterium]